MLKSEQQERDHETRGQIIKIQILGGLPTDYYCIIFNIDPNGCNFTFRKGLGSEINRAAERALKI